MEVEDDFENDYSDREENEENEEQFAQLQASVSQMDTSQRIKAPKRNELGSSISEFHLKETTSTSTSIANELINVLEKKKGNLLKNKVKALEKKGKPLPKPLEKPVAEQIKRKLGFENVKNQLGAWEPVVEANRVADHLVFPLIDEKLNIKGQKNFFSRFVTQTPLEKELNAVLHGEQQPAKEDEPDEFPLTLEEMIEKRKEMAKLRARQSFNEAKAYRQSKIKSKKYHRIQKREKIKQQIKEFELLQKTDPEAALKKLEELEKTRAEERATLRHKSTGKWAKSLAVRAKYDEASRKVLAEQLAISRDMTMKTKPVDSSDDEDIPDPTILKDAIDIAKSNPWSLEVSSEVNSFISGVKKFYGQQKVVQDANKKEDTGALVQQEDIEVQPITTPTVSTKEKKEKLKSGAIGKWLVSPVVEDKKALKRKVTSLDLDEAFYVANKKLAAQIKRKFKTLNDKIKVAPQNTKKNKRRDNKTVSQLKMKKSRWQVERAELDDELGNMNVEEEDNVKKRTDVKDPSSYEVVNPSQVNIDPEKFIKVKPHVVKTPLPDDVEEGDEEALDEGEQHKVIMEAFADDNVTDFRDAKKDAEKETELEVVPELPGWGSWGGVGVVHTKRRRRRFLKMPTLPDRKDKVLPDVIINEDANPKIKAHMVKEIPYPFRSVEAFEANIRAPISRDWVPELTHRDLIRPAVITRQGTVIEPMNEEVLLRQKRKFKSVYQAKTRQKSKLIVKKK